MSIFLMFSCFLDYYDRHITSDPNKLKENMFGKFANYAHQGKDSKNDRIAFGYVSDVDIKVNGKDDFFLFLKLKGIQLMKNLGFD